MTVKGSSVGANGRATRTDLSGAGDNIAYQTRVDVLAAIMLILVLWEIMPRLGIVPRLFVPAFSESLIAGWKNHSRYVEAFWVTAMTVLVASAIALCFGITVGLLIGSVKSLNGFLRVFSAFSALPIVAIYPVLCVLLGFGPQPRILLGIFFGIVPIILIVGEATRLVDPQLKILLRSLGAGQWQRLAMLYVPAIMPALFSAIRISAGLVIIGVVVGEMMLSSSGLGYLVTYFRTTFDSASLYFSVLLIIMIVIIVDRTIFWTSSLAGKWGLEIQNNE